MNKKKTKETSKPIWIYNLDKKASIQVDKEDLQKWMENGWALGKLEKS